MAIELVALDGDEKIARLNRAAIDGNAGDIAGLTTHRSTGGS
jgi:hypothetical protein